MMYQCRLFSIVQIEGFTIGRVELAEVSLRTLHTNGCLLAGLSYSRELKLQFRELAKEGSNRSFDPLSKRGDP
jgi:hypothetical protein